MFTAEDRDRVRARLLGLAETDPDIAGAALIGSHVAGSEDRWSDVDLAIAVRGPVGAALERWTAWMRQEYDTVHHWDLPSGPAVYRLFLLPGWLEVDIGFMPEASFGPRGPNWRTVFGATVHRDPVAPPSHHHLAGFAWHHILRGSACIERGRLWQAEHWISGLRDQVLALACLRLDLPTANAKGAHELPWEVVKPLEDALVRSLDAMELRRALVAAANALLDELDRSDADLANRLRPLVTELWGTAGDHH